MLGKNCIKVGTRRVSMNKNPVKKAEIYQNFIKLQDESMYKTNPTVRLTNLIINI